MSNYALYTTEQLAHERSIGLELSDYDNENFYNPNSGNTYEWTTEQFEAYLSTREWSEENKAKHRGLFNGKITFDNGAISY